MSSISTNALELIESLSRVTGSQFELNVDSDRNLTVSSGSPLTPDESRFREEVQALLRRDFESSATIVRLTEELRIANENNEALVQRNKALSEKMTRDLLTGLYTRWFVEDKINQELQRARRHEFPLSVLMVDVDHFKRVNDEHGHLVGDEVLREMGRLILESLRAYDIPGRYGGEEFCLLLPSTPLEHTMIVAERLRERIAENLLQTPDASVHVTASIGVAGVEGADSVHQAVELISLADQALYRAKNSGRNRVEAFN